MRLFLPNGLASFGVRFMFDQSDSVRPADPQAYGAQSLSALSPEAELALRQFARRAVAANSAEPFLDGIVRLLWAEYDTHVVFVGALDPDGERVTARIVFVDGMRSETFSYGLAGTPCETVIGPASICLYPQSVQSKFPDDDDLVGLQAEGYAGVPLFDICGKRIGILVAITSVPMEDPDSISATLQFFAPKAAVELERILAAERGAYDPADVDAESAKVDEELGDALRLNDESDH